MLIKKKGGMGAALLDYPDKIKNVNFLLTR